MATRSRIAVLQEDGSVKSIYCHNDGYPSHNGDILLKYYNSEEKANELINLGGLSFLDKHVAPLEVAPKAHHWGETPPPMIKAEQHSFDNPQEGVTVAYHRDRKEEFKQTIFPSLDTYRKGENWEDYGYLWKDGAWHIADGGAWLPLTEEITENGLPSEREE